MIFIGVVVPNILGLVRDCNNPSWESSTMKRQRLLNTVHLGYRGGAPVCNNRFNRSTIWLWLTVRHGKSPFLSSLNHLFLWAMASMAMLVITIDLYLPETSTGTTGLWKGGVAPLSGIHWIHCFKLGFIKTFIKPINTSVSWDISTYMVDIWLLPTWKRWFRWYITIDFTYVGKTMSQTTQSTGNGFYYTTYKNGDDWGMVYHCFTNMIPLNGYFNRDHEKFSNFHMVIIQGICFFSI